MGASDWLRSLGQDRAAFADKPALVLWGLKDIAFRRKELEPWTSALRGVEVREFEDYGHFVAQKAPGGSWRRFGGSWGDCRADGASNCTETPVNQPVHPRQVS